MKTQFTLLILLYMVYFTDAQQRSGDPQIKQYYSMSGESIKSSQIKYQFISAPDNTWGYDIYVNERLMIHQSSLPGLPGNAGFKTKEQAKKVAELVITKIKKGEMPPSVTRQEMIKLQAL